MTKQGKDQIFFPQERCGVILKENTSHNTVLLIAVVSLGYFTYIPALLQFFFEIMLNFSQWLFKLIYLETHLCRKLMNCVLFVKTQS